MSPIHTLQAEDPPIDLSGGAVGLVAGVAIVAALALLVAAYLVREVLAANAGTPKMIEVGRAVQEGAAAYLRRQFRTLAGFVIVIPFVLLLLPADDTGARVGRSVFFVVGAVFSALVGFVGMSLATRANTRTAAAAIESGERAAMRIAFRTGGVVGMFTVGLGLLGAAVVVLAFRDTAPQVLEGFGFGAALLAMFMRVGGGIFTKAADVGADLVGKVEQGIPEDDPRNAATIADNVGDNVGDCAGMAADLFESYAVTLVAALILGVKAFGENGLVYPLLIPAVGVLTAIIGIFAVSPRDGDRTGMTAINRGFFISAVVSAIGVVIVSMVYLPGSFAEFPGLEGSTQSGDPRVIAISAVLIGIVLAAAIQLLTGYFTETNRRPVLGVAEASTTGPATNILAGIGVGLESAVYSALLIGAAVFGAYLLGSGSVTIALFAVALAGTGLLTTVGVIVSMDTFGPVSDNAQGIAEMSAGPEGIDERAGAILTSLDAVGNTTKAITKGIAIATAVLAATALFGSFTDTVTTALADAGASTEAARGTVGGLNIAYPDALVGLIIGAAVVFLFSGLAINAVGRAAGRVVMEVRNQFRTKPGIMEGTEKPDYGAVVDICTRDSLRELVTPGTLAVMAPIAVGFGLGYPPLGAFLGGAIAAGVLMAVFLANSGGAWDNAKKLVEDGNYGGKGSEVHAATVIGDTVGDPFKDTAGPSINPLLKVMNLVSLLIAPLVVKFSVGEDENTAARIGIALAAVVVIVAVVATSRRRGSSVGDGPPTPSAPPTRTPPSGSEVKV
ncbi:MULTISPECIES: sodium-translocating pyrophosphatase [Parafrankia]|uniref:K(+)-insensitive pyrophosphate-energized proton pump n=1 Tax=Parafrankia soli TaxID=2599596 RepID=A0A1S1PM15_9ACTN|nr:MULTISPECIES: sodium-translocating pyrophosphatase [Parafrankia]OHV22311.1 sodium-translocating pyrophosphatase [Parafrankia soli]TCJ40681.1 sodium-translocating pyrophosphatase [Parafrankia sp. BMG5.11]CAI7978674.1 K(+)-insensitive pyrophosphate-energized proton pump [Frankia sp. Hr75.2]SQD99237.1 K(+)-insensitive pyrophosphate-energized proton pump [Parafrankia sp. Ea1.12]